MSDYDPQFLHMLTWGAVPNDPNWLQWFMMENDPYLNIMVVPGYWDEIWVGEYRRIWG
jgi:hypothetical protein